MRFPLIERPEVYREGGGGLGKILKGSLSAITLGASDALLGGLEQQMPDMPSGPDTVQTGQLVGSKDAKTFEEDKAKKNARKTARKGTGKFRIPLANVTTGAKTQGGSGLKI